MNTYVINAWGVKLEGVWRGGIGEGRVWVGGD